MYRKFFPSVDAHSEPMSEGNEIKSSEEGVADGDTKSKKPKKEKIGFRDRKVSIQI